MNQISYPIGLSLWGLTATNIQQMSYISNTKSIAAGMVPLLPPPPDLLSPGT
jgi:hypothetical protein